MGQQLTLDEFRARSLPTAGVGRDLNVEVSVDSPVEEPGSSPAPIDMMDYVRILMRRRWVILGVFVAVMLGGAAYTLRQPKVYSATTSMIIDPTAPRYLDNQVGDVNEGGGSYYWLSKEFYQTRHRVITSRAVSQRVVDKLGLQNDLAFLSADKIRDEKVRKQYLEKVDAVALLQSKLSLEPQKDSRVVHIVIKDGDPERAALLSNEVAEAYIAESLSQKQELTQNASEWLEDRLLSLETSTKKSEVALYDFKKQADMLSTSLEDRVNMVSQRLTALNAALTDVKVRIAGLRARVDSINELRKQIDRDESQWADLLAIPDTQRDLIKQFKVAHVDAKRECAEIKERYLESHPSLLACDEKLRVASEALQRELKNVVTAQEVDLAESLKKEKNLLGLLEEAKADAFQVNKRQIEHDRLKREADSDQRLYELVLNRIKELEISGMLKTSNARVLDKARPAFSPIKPNVSMSLMLSCLLAALAGIGVAFVLEWMDDSIVHQRDVEERIGLSLLGIVPTIQEKDHRGGSKDLHLHTHPKSAAAEHCRAVRTNLLFMSPDRPLRTMVVTSSGPQEGKSTTVINLGIAMAQSGSRILLVDTDMRRPRLHKAFGVSNDAGISSSILGGQVLDQAIKSTDVPGLFLLPCGPIPPNPSELLHTESFKALIRELSGRFDRLIFDSPPIGAVADALVLGAQVDGVLLVLRSGKTRRDMARRAARALVDVNARLFGAVLNNVNLDDRRYGAQYGYAQYGYYSGESKDQLAGLK